MIYPLDLPANPRYSTKLHSQFLDIVSKCRKCPNRNPDLAICGDPLSPFVFVGNGFSKAELAQKVLWSSKTRAGRCLSRYLNQLGICRESCYFTSAFLHPFSNNSECYSFKRIELAVLRPRILFLLGKNAKESVLGERSSMCMDNRIYQTKSYFICSVPHPTTLIGNVDLAEQSLQFLSTISHLLIESDLEMRKHLL